MQFDPVSFVLHFLICLAKLGTKYPKCITVPDSITLINPLADLASVYRTRPEIFKAYNQIAHCKRHKNTI